MNDEYQIKPGTILRISPSAASNLHAFRQAEGTNEAGGILLGREFIDQAVIVEEVTTPTAGDKTGPTWFERCRETAQQKVNEAWERSGGELIYIGEWHTHPEENPLPSPRDRVMIRNMFRQTKMEIDFLILIIVGTMDVWIGIENGRSLRQLSPSHKGRNSTSLKNMLKRFGKRTR